MVSIPARHAGSPSKKPGSRHSELCIRRESALHVNVGSVSVWDVEEPAIPNCPFCGQLRRTKVMLLGSVIVARHKNRDTTTVTVNYRVILLLSVDVQHLQSCNAKLGGRYGASTYSSSI